MGIYIKIKKIKRVECTKEILSSLSAKGISRLPALITNVNKTFIGTKNIRTLFEKNITEFRQHQRMNENPSTSVEEFFQREMTLDRLEDQEPRDGLSEPSSNLQHKYQDMLQKRNITEERANKERKERKRRPQIHEDEEDNNIAAPTTMRSSIAHSLHNTMHLEGGDPEDARMEQFMLENQWGQASDY